MPHNTPLTSALRVSLQRHHGCPPRFCFFTSVPIHPSTDSWPVSLLGRKVLFLSSPITPPSPSFLHPLWNSHLFLESIKAGRFKGDNMSDWTFTINHVRFCDCSSAAVSRSVLPFFLPRHLGLLPVQKYQQAVEALKDQLSSYCIQVCSTCVLQDAESHHWADPKPFYEVKYGELNSRFFFFFLYDSLLFVLLNVNAKWKTIDGLNLTFCAHCSSFCVYRCLMFSIRFASMAVNTSMSMKGISDFLY